MSVPKTGESHDGYSDEETARRRDAVVKHMLNSPPKPRSAMVIGKRKAKASPKASPQSAGGDGVMIVYDVQTLPDGDVAIGKPYKRLPDGTVAALIAS